MRIGPKKIIGDRVPRLEEFLDSFGGQGFCGWSDWGPPGECLDFVVDQFNRFGVPLNSECRRMIEAAGNAVLCYTDVFDPYSTLISVSDVEMTDEWENHTYEISYPGRATKSVADPSLLETYVFNPAQGEYWFNYMLSHPGLGCVPFHIGTNLRYETEDLIDRYAPGERDLLREFCGDKLNNYVDLATWAAFVWLVGPYGRTFRADHCLLHDVVVNRGQAIIYEYDVLSPDCYTKTSVAYRACAQCGLDSYCTELVQTATSAKYLCEHCLHEGMFLYPEASCGGRRCKYVECPHNRFHQLGNRAEALHTIMRSSGMLIDKKNERLLIA